MKLGLEHVAQILSSAQLEYLWLSATVVLRKVGEECNDTSWSQPSGYMELPSSLLYSTMATTKLEPSDLSETRVPVSKCNELPISRGGVQLCSLSVQHCGTAFTGASSLSKIGAPIFNSYIQYTALVAGRSLYQVAVYAIDPDHLHLQQDEDLPQLEIDLVFVARFGVLSRHELASCHCSPNCLVSCSIYHSW